MGTFPAYREEGFDGAGADADFGLADPLAYIQHANEQVFLMLQIEDGEAVDRIDEIAAVEGFELFFVGPPDLSLSYGVPMEFDHAIMQEAVASVAAAARKNGKWWGISTGSPEAAQGAVDGGARMITAGGDHPFLVRGFQRASEEFGRVGSRQRARRLNDEGARGAERYLRSVSKGFIAQKRNRAFVSYLRRRVALARPSNRTLRNSDA